MAKYIDADKTLENLPDDLSYKGSVKRVLIQAPAEDVVKVIRCGKCKHWNDKRKWLGEGYIGDCYNDKFRSRTYHRPVTYETDFCSSGERRDTKWIIKSMQDK